MAARIIETIVSSELILENRAPVSPDMYHLGSGFSNSLILPDPLFVNMRKVYSTDAQYMQLLSFSRLHHCKLRVLFLL